MVETHAVQLVLDVGSDRLVEQAGQFTTALVEREDVDRVRRPVRGGDDDALAVAERVARPDIHVVDAADGDLRQRPAVEAMHGELPGLVRDRDLGVPRVAGIAPDRRVVRRVAGIRHRLRLGRRMHVDDVGRLRLDLIAREDRQRRAVDDVRTVSQPPVATAMPTRAGLDALACDPPRRLQCYHDARQLLADIPAAPPPADVIVTLGHVLVQLADNQQAIGVFATILEHLTRKGVCLVLAVDALGSRERFQRSFDCLCETLEETDCVWENRQDLRSSAFGVLRGA